MKGISRRDFAKRDGCSETLVRRGISQGRLVAFDDGSIDASLIGTPWRRGNRLDTAPDDDVPAVPAVAHDGITHAEADRLKAVYLAKLRELEFLVKSNRLCDVDAVYKAVFEISRAVRAGWESWPARRGPLIAAENGCDPVKLVISLEKHVREHLFETAGDVERFSLGRNAPQRPPPAPP